MTLLPRYWWRSGLLAGISTEPRLFRTTPDTQLLGYCHWQPDRCSTPTVILVHGLEGCSESHYMHGIASKAYRASLNVMRLNQRTCGGTEHLTPTLYNSGLSGDFRVIVQELASKDGLSQIWLVGYSMGGNLILKAAGELGPSEPALAGAIAVCPNIDPTQCVMELERPGNWIYPGGQDVSTGMPDTRIKARGERAGIGLTNLPDLDPDLARLAPYFQPRGRMELRGCSVGGGFDGLKFLGDLAKALGVEVCAALNEEPIGPLEWAGPVLTVAPTGGQRTDSGPPIK